MSQARKALKPPKTRADYIFCVVIGTIFVYALTRTIFSATIIRLPNSTYMTLALVSVLLFLLVFYNRITRIAALCAVVLFILYALHILRAGTYDNLHPRVQHFYDLFAMIGGLRPFDPALGRTAAWAVSLAFAAPVVIFMFYKFSFVVLATTGALVFVLVWGPGFSRDEASFLLFLFVFCVILVRKMNGTAATALLVAPLCAAAVWLANGQLPTQSDMFVRRPISQVTSAMEALGDRMFEVFNPTYFSFQSTGFAGAGGRLGGPVSLNSRSVMDVYAPGGTYLAGAVSNTYTGFSWLPTLEAGDIYTHGLTPGHFEMLETAAALIRGATLADDRQQASAWRLFDGAATGGVSPVDAHFARLQVLANGGYALYTYLPMDTAEIRMDRQRSGSVFRPANAWDLHFAGSGRDYLPVVQVLPTGDMQTPRMMSRDTTYRWQFLNVNPMYDFVAYLLRQAEAGVHAQRANQDNWWQHGTLRGEIVGLNPFIEGVPPASPIIFDIRDMVFAMNHGIRIPWDDVPTEYLAHRHLVNLAEDYYYVRQVFEEIDWIFYPVPADEAILEAIDELRWQSQWSDGDWLRWQDMTERLWESIPQPYHRPDLTFEYMDGRLYIGFYIEGEMIERIHYSPLENYWGSFRLSSWHSGGSSHSSHFSPGRFHEGLRSGTALDSLVQVPQHISPEIAHFQNITTFGVEEMQILLDLLVNAQDTLGSIPRESYLIHWLDMFSTDVLADYAQAVRLHFMDVPEIVPQRVHDLTLSIVEGYTGDFDRVMAIRDFLLQFPYTLNPAPVPRDVCFVDHFLFVGQEGYCTYFASAMAVMARIAGVPSRYVEGFVLPPSANHMERVTVTNRMAHAWVEVYLEGFGWHIVEATPTYAFLANPALPGAIGGSSQPFDEDWHHMMAEYMDYMEFEMSEPLHSGQAGPGAAAQTGAEAPAEDDAIHIMLWLAALAVIGAIMFFTLRFLHVVQAHVKMRKQPLNAQVIAYFEGLLEMVSYYTIPMEAGETPKIYGVHKGKRFAYKSDSVFFKDLINLYYKARYSPHQVTEAECALMEEAYFDMVKLIRNQRWRPVFVYLRYVRRVGAV